MSSYLPIPQIKSITMDSFGDFVLEIPKQIVFWQSKDGWAHSVFSRETCHITLGYDVEREEYGESWRTPHPEMAFNVSEAEAIKLGD